jgi:hypothetical protein
MQLVVGVPPRTLPLLASHRRGCLRPKGFAPAPQVSLDPPIVRPMRLPHSQRRAHGRWPLPNRRSHPRVVHVQPFRIVSVPTNIGMRLIRQEYARWLTVRGDSPMIERMAHGLRESSDHPICPSGHSCKTGFAPILDPDDPYRYLEIRGVVDIEDDPERKLIDRLSKKYHGKEPYPNHKPGTRESSCVSARRA